MSGRGRGLRRGLLGGRYGFLTGDMEDRVILDTMDDLGGPQGSYPEGFMSLSLFLAEICKLVVLVKKHEIQTDNIQSSDIRHTLQKFNIDCIFGCRKYNLSKKFGYV